MKNLNEIEKAYHFQKKGNYFDAITHFKQGLANVKEPKIKIKVLSFIIKCYFQLNLHEDCLEYCGYLLKIDPNHAKG